MTFIIRPWAVLSVGTRPTTTTPTEYTADSGSAPKQGRGPARSVDPTRQTREVPPFDIGAAREPTGLEGRFQLHDKRTRISVASVDEYVRKASEQISRS